MGINENFLEKFKALSHDLKETVNKIKKFDTKGQKKFYS